MILTGRREGMLKKLNEAMDYIEEHLEEDFSLDKIAEYVHVSDLHLV